LTAALVAVLLPVSGGGSAATQQTPKRGGTVAIGTTTAFEPGCLRVFDGCGIPPVDFPLDMSHVLAGAFKVTPDATFRGDLVSSARIVSKEPFTLVYRIRREARWNDGVPVTARDFVFTHEVLRKRVPSADESVYIRSIRRLNRKTVQVVLRTRYVDWRYLFDIVLPRHALAGEDLATVWQARITNPKTGSAIGSGPFLVAGWERGERLTFVRNRRYWGRHTAYLDSFAYRFLPPEEIADALRDREVDMIHYGPAVLEAQHRALRQGPEPGISVVAVPVGSFEHLTIRVGNGGHPALKDPLVRRALAYGIDRVAIARTIGGLSFVRPSALAPQDSMIFVRSSRHYVANWSRYRHRAAEARRLLGEAGCRIGADGIYVCDGIPLSLRLGTPAGIERRELTVRLAQEQLRRIGIEVRLEVARPAVFFGTVIPSGDFDLASFAWILDASTSGPGTNLTCQSETNFGGWCDRLVTRDLLQATRTLDLGRRVALLNRIDSRLAQAVPHIPLYQGNGLFAFDATVRAVQPGAAGSFTWNVEDWWLDD
jgi:peptide/nickel transport system substrate-binding protein